LNIEGCDFPLPQIYLTINARKEFSPDLQHPSGKPL